MIKNKNPRNNYSESLARLEHYSQHEHGLLLKTANAWVKIFIYNSSTIRIWINKDEASFEDDFSYAVSGRPVATDYRLDEQEEMLIITTEKVVMQIRKNAVRFEFYTLDGRLINQDDEAFGTSWQGNQVTTYKALQPFERFIGLGEKTGNLDRRGRAYTHWNTDYFGYPADGDPLYASTPFYIGVHSGLSYGIFLDNTHKSVFNFGASNDRFAYFSAEDGDMNYYFIYDEKVSEILYNYSLLTGTTPVPPMWSLGYQQCRYSYYPDKEVLNVARTFREKDIPADVIYLDIHYMDAYKIFTWHPDYFPDPEGMLAQLKEMGFHVVIIVDPGIKKEEGYRQFDEGRREELFVKYPDGTNYSASVWPGDCHFPDFTNPETREWWGAAFEIYTKAGVDGFWNDMNEPASWGQTTPDLIEFDYEGRGATHKKARNMYGMQMARSTFEGTKKLLDGRRPFVLTRAAFSGIQRYAAVWTGDNTASDEHMLVGVRLVNSLGLTGVTYAGYDVGGFVGEASTSLFARWISIGAFTPFFRGHSMINSRDSEPWAYGEEVEEISRNYIKMRYKLMPYIYSLFYEASQTGMPVSRSLTIDYTHDPYIYQVEYQNQYLFGPSILVAPVPSTYHISKIYLPAGEWYDMYTDELHQGNKSIMQETPIDKLPLFVKGGAIIPMQTATSSIKEKPESVLFIHVYKGTVDNSFEYYEDDGDTYQYEHGKYLKRRMEYHAAENTFTIAQKEGNYVSGFERVRILFHGFDITANTIRVNGNDINVVHENVVFFPRISAFDPLYHQAGALRTLDNLPTVEVNFIDSAIKVEW